MSEGNNNGAALDAETKTDHGVSSSDADGIGSSSTAPARESFRTSSTPALVGDTSVKQPDATDADLVAGDDVGVDNESEAETLISSPVKKREAQKQINGIKTEASETGGIEGCKYVRLDAEVHVKSGAPKPTTTDQGHESNDAQVEAENGVLETHKDVASDDGKGGTLWARSRSDSLDSGEISESAGEENIVREANGNGKGQGAHNGRKRKHRDSSPSRKQLSMEPPRRRRRASSLTNAQDKAERSSEERSPPPRLRSHRRTASVQTDGAADMLVNGAGRRRRALSQFPVQDTKLSKHTWESDSSSEASQKHPQNRLTRSLNRSVSTPGRSLGRDHKRHVNKYGFTRLAEACESGELEAVKEWREKDPEQLEQREFAGNTPLQVASLNGYPEIVQYLLDQGCTPHCANTDKDTPLIDAVENGHTDVVRLLLGAGVDPLRQNMKGQQALDVITDQTEDGPAIRALLREAIEQWSQNGGKQSQQDEEMGYRPGPTKGLQFMARTYANLLVLVKDNDRSGVQEFLDARVAVDNEVVAAAARTGDLYLVNMLLAEMSPKKARSKAEKPMLAAIGTSHFEMVKTLTELDQFNPTWRSKSTGMTWYELAEHRQGPSWRQERALLYQLFMEGASSNRLSSSPVSKRDAGIRRKRSPVRTMDSDAEMEDADSPEVSRNRRRLMSKKDMRAASRRRSSSASSSPSRSSNSPDQTKSSRSPEEERVRPQSRRKIGRPRTKSMTSQGSEPRPKRLRSSSMREKPPAFDTPNQSSGNIRSDDRALQENAIEEEPDQEEEQRRRDAAEAQEKARLAAKIKLEETLKAEAARQAELEAERLRQEELARLERQAAEDRRKLRNEQLAALPSALKQILEMTEAESAKKARYASSHFTPIRAIRGALLGQALEEQHVPWMLSYQAAGLLTGSTSAQLLDLVTDSPGEAHAFADAPKLAVSDAHRIGMLASLGSSSLVHNLPATNASESVEAMFEAAERAYQIVQVDRAKFIALSSLRWIRCSDFFAAKDALKPAHLEHLSLDLDFSACLDQSPFLNTQADSTVKAVVTHIPVPDGKPNLNDTVDEKGQVRIGTTKVAVVMD